MNWKKTICWTALGLLFLLMLVTAVVFLLASSVPSAWSKNVYQLSNSEQKRVAKEKFAPKALELLNDFEDVKPFVHEVRQDDLNEYFASLDEIAFLRLGPSEVGQKSGQVREAMDEAGLVDPAIKISDGLLTLMVRTKGSNKVLSLDLRLPIREKMFHPKIEQVRIGHMPIPRSFVKESLGLLRDTLARRAAETKKSNTKLDLNLLLAEILIAAIEEKPISTVPPISKKKPKRIQRLDIEEGVLKIHFVPIAREEE